MVKAAFWTKAQSLVLFSKCNTTMRTFSPTWYYFTLFRIFQQGPQTSMDYFIFLVRNPCFESDDTGLSSSQKILKEDYVTLR